MNKREKARKIQSILDQLYPEVDIPLRHHDPYTLLVAVLLSAQTTDKAVNLVTPALFELARTPAEMAERAPEEVLAIIRPLGLAPQKSRHVVAMGRQLVERFQGLVPRTLEELESLSGVGHKTASVVLCQAFGIPAFPVDTHIHRLAARWGLSTGKSVEKTESDLKALFAKKNWIKLHLQIIYFGRQYCPAKGHQEATCPICRWAANPQRM